jgi:3-deoxy-D-arabino-heptulosonate 7-phosphate (DAHP) synthase
MNVSMNSRDGEASDDVNGIQVDYDEDCSDDDHQKMVGINSEVQSEVTNDATSMTGIMLCLIYFFSVPAHSTVTLDHTTQHPLYHTIYMHAVYTPALRYDSISLNKNY